MKDRRILLYAALALMAFNCGPCSTPTVPPSDSPPAGFTKALFSRKMVMELLTAKGCVAMRVYNARRTEEDTRGTAMVIPTDGDRDLYDPESQMYCYYERLRSTDAEWGRFTEEEAVRSTEWVRAGRDSAYAADFSAEEVSALLATKECTGLLVTPERLSTGHYTMRLQPVVLGEDDYRVLGDGTVYAVDGEPCPVYCGHMPSLYVHMRD